MTASRRQLVATRAVSAVAGGWGLALLARPRQVSRAVLRAPAHVPDGVVRLLGARLVVQHGIVLARPTRGAVLAGTAVDAVHAASMVAAAVAFPRARRAAVVSGLTTVVFGAAGRLSAPPAGRR